MNRPLLLLIDGRSLTLPSVGVGVYALRLIQGLLRQAPDLNFKVLLPPEIKPSDLGIPESRMIALPTPPRLGNQYIESFVSNIQVTLFLRKHHPDAVFHATNAFWSPLRPHCTLITMHDVIPRRFPRYFGRTPLRRIMQRLQERFAAGAKHVLAVSRCTADDLTTLAGIPSDKISVHYNWVGEEFARWNRATAQQQIANLLEKYHLPSNYWLYLGGYDYRKNVEFLIRAYASAKHRSPVKLPPLVLAGQIPTDLSKPYCDVDGALRATGLTAEDIVTPGRIASDDLPTLYGAASLLIYPSLFEGFGYPAAEAMAVGTPLLVSDSSSLPEVVRTSECRFDPTNLESLTAKLLEAGVDAQKFISPLPLEFTEKEAIRTYVKLVMTKAIG